MAGGSMQEAGGSGSKGGSSVPVIMPPNQDSRRNWRLVEVAGYYDPITNEAGGAFILHDEDHTPLLVRAFPIASGPPIFTEAVAVRQALEAMVRLGKERILLCISSQVLLGFFCRGEASGIRALDCVVAEGIEWFRRASAGLRLVLVRSEMVANALSLAETGARSQQHMQWDRPLLEEMLRLGRVHESESN